MCIVLDRNKSYFVKNLKEYVPNYYSGSVYVYLDPLNAVYILNKNKIKTDRYMFLGIAKGEGDILLKNIKTIIHDYDRSPNITFKSRVVSMFGKKGLIDKAFVREVDNPWYKTAGKMRLYDVNVIKANLY